MSKRLMFFCLCLVLILSLISCHGAEQGPVGRWEISITDEELGQVALVYHFTEEGEVFLEQKEGDKIPFSIPFGTFSVSGETLSICSDGKESVYHFSLEADTLILTAEGEEPLVFQKV